MSGRTRPDTSAERVGVRHYVMEGKASLKGTRRRFVDQSISASTSISSSITISSSPVSSLHLAARFTPFRAKSEPDTLITPPWHPPSGHSSGRSFPATAPTGRATSRRMPRPRASAHSQRRTSHLWCIAHRKTTEKPRGESLSPYRLLHTSHAPTRHHPLYHTYLLTITSIQSLS